MDHPVVKSLIFQSNVAKDLGVPEATSLLREAAALIIEAAKDKTLSKKDRKELGDLAVVFDNVGDNVITALRQRVSAVIMEEAKSALKELENGIQEHHGKSGLKQSAPYTKSWFLGIVYEALSDGFVDESVQAVQEQFEALSDKSKEESSDGTVAMTRTKRRESVSKLRALADKVGNDTDSGLKLLAASDLLAAGLG